MRNSYIKYRSSVMKDLAELKIFYPFSKEIIHPWNEPGKIELIVIAASKNVIEATSASEEDFLGEYSKELKVVIPYDYRSVGCDIYGAKWIDLGNIDAKDWHFFSCDDNGIKKFCLGVPNSFSHLKNVILENVKTAENMLIAYERLLSGKSKKLELKAYSHGAKGKVEYEKDKRRYQNN